jgi:hypothetical protein
MYEDGFIPVKLVKRSWDTTLVVATLAALLGCQGLSKSAPSPSPGQLTAAKNSINFGNVQTGKSVTLDSAITNTGASKCTDFSDCGKRNWLQYFRNVSTDNASARSERAIQCNV